MGLSLCQQRGVELVYVTHEEDIGLRAREIFETYGKANVGIFPELASAHAIRPSSRVFTDRLEVRLPDKACQWTESADSDHFQIADLFGAERDLRQRLSLSAQLLDPVAVYNSINQGPAVGFNEFGTVGVLASAPA